MQKMQIKRKKEIAKRGLKQEKGITLIALVITIIVLLILAGVAIASLTGENGILNRAGEAKSATERAQIIEQAQIAVLNAEVVANGKTLTGTEIKQVLSNSKLFEANSVSAIDETQMSDEEYLKNTKLTSADGKFNDIKLLEILGSVTKTAGGDDEEETTGTLPTNENIGDTVSYMDITGDSDAADWRIFYTTSSGTFIITSDYAQVGTSPISTAVSNAGMTTTTPYIAYWSSVPSETSFDANASTFMNAWPSASYNNAKCTASLLKTSNWGGSDNTWTGLLTSSVKAAGGLAIGGPTVEMFKASWNETQTTQLYTAQNSNGYGYNIGTSENPTSTYVNGLDTTQTLYFPHNEAVSNCYGYWLASPSASSNNYVVIVHNNGLVDSRYYYSYANYGLRPLVYLPSSVQLTQNGNVWTVGS